MSDNMSHTESSHQGHEMTNSTSSSSDIIFPGAMLIVGSFLVIGVLICRNFLKNSPFASKKTLGLGVFVMLSGGILLGTSLIKPATSTMEGMDHGSMSHDEMMAVDGAFNPTPVTVEVVKPSLLTASVQYTGSIYPYLDVIVYPRVAGQLMNYSVYPGDRVEMGQTLAELDAAELHSEVRETIAAADSLQTDLETTKIEIEEQKQQINQITAELNYLEKKRDRFSMLVKEGAISVDEFDIVESEAIAKQANLAEAKTKLTRLQAKVASDAAKVSQAKAQIETASIMKSYAQIPSPISGIVQERLVDPGVVVQPGMGILKIGDYNRLRLRANVAQQDAINLKRGSHIIAKFPGSNKEPIHGEITSIFPQTDSRTRTITVEAVIDNPDGELLSGQFIEMELVTAKKPSAISVPTAAISEFKEQPAVWVIEGDLARRKVIKTGLVTGERVEVTEGLKPNDLVVISGGQKLIENSRVAAINESGEPLVAENSAHSAHSEHSEHSEHSNHSETAEITLLDQDKIKVGNAELIMEVRNPETGELLPVNNLEVSVTMPMKNMAPMTPDVTVKPYGDGRFLIQTNLGMAGAWHIMAEINDPQYQGQGHFNIDVKK